jgi:PKD repeat protein
MMKQLSIASLLALFFSLQSIGQSLQISASSVNGCAPLSVTFSCNQTSTSYNWSFSNGTTSSASNPVVVFTSGGSYGATVTLANGNSASVSNAVTVFPKPTPTFVLDTHTVCLGTAVHFTASGFNGSSYYWDMGNGTVLTGVDVTHTYAQPGTYSIAIQETSSNGCVGASTSVNAVTVHPVPNLNISTSLPHLCTYPDTVAFTASPANLASYQWTMNGSSTLSTAQTLTRIFNAPSLNTVQVSASNAFGCSGNKVITYNAYDPIQPNFSSPSPTACTPMSVPVNVAGQNFNTILWQSSGGQIATGPSAQFNFNSAGIHFVAFSANDVHGCPVQDTLGPITALATPNAGFSLNDSMFCDQANLIATANTSGASSYQWNIGTNSYTGNPINTTLTALGTYQVSLQVTASNGCSNS